jgi:hypothetical protein
LTHGESDSPDTQLKVIKGLTGLLSSIQQEGMASSLTEDLHPWFGDMVRLFQKLSGVRFFFSLPEWMRVR